MEWMKQWNPVARQIHRRSDAQSSPDKSDTFPEPVASLGSPLRQPPVSAGCRSDSCRGICSRIAVSMAFRERHPSRLQSASVRRHGDNCKVGSWRSRRRPDTAESARGATDPAGRKDTSARRHRRRWCSNIRCRGNRFELVRILRRAASRQRRIREFDALNPSGVEVTSERLWSFLIRGRHDSGIFCSSHRTHVADPPSKAEETTAPAKSA